MVRMIDGVCPHAMLVAVGRVTSPDDSIVMRHCIRRCRAAAAACHTATVAHGERGSCDPLGKTSEGLRLPPVSTMGVEAGGAHSARQTTPCRAVQDKIPST